MVVIDRETTFITCPANMIQVQMSNKLGALLDLLLRNCQASSGNHGNAPLNEHTSWEQGLDLPQRPSGYELDKLPRFSSNDLV